MLHTVQFTGKVPWRISYLGTDGSLSLTWNARLYSGHSIFGKAVGCKP